MAHTYLLKFCSFIYITLFVLSLVEVLILEKYPDTYVQGQVYSLKDISYDTINERISKLVAQNPSLTKGFEGQETYHNYIKKYPDHYTECELYIEELKSVLYFSIYETNNGLNISLNGRKETWSIYDDSYKSTFNSLNPDKVLSIDENRTLSLFFEKSILSHLGDYKKESLYGAFVWYYYFFQRYIIFFGSFFVMCIMFLVFLFISKYKSI